MGKELPLGHSLVEELEAQTNQDVELLCSRIVDTATPEEMNETNRLIRFILTGREFPHSGQYIT